MGRAGWYSANGPLFLVVRAMSCPKVCDDHDAIYVQYLYSTVTVILSHAP
jgi:hypothetical protein